MFWKACGLFSFNGGDPVDWDAVWTLILQIIRLTGVDELYKVFWKETGGMQKFIPNLILSLISAVLTEVDTQCVNQAQAMTADIVRLALTMPFGEQQKNDDAQSGWYNYGPNWSGGRGCDDRVTLANLPTVLKDILKSFLNLIEKSSTGRKNDPIHFTINAWI